MRIHTVADPTDPVIGDYRNLTDVSLRRRTEPAAGIFMAESQSVIARALAAGYRPQSALTIERWLPQVEQVLEGFDVDVYVGPEDVVRDITGYRVHRGALAVMERKPLPRVLDVLADARRVVVLEGIVDHTNVGAAFRSAAGMGFDAVLIDPTCADPLYRRSVRVSMGAVFSLPWTRMDHWPDELNRLKEHGFVTASLTPAPSAQEISLWAVAAPEKVALLLGAEGDGLRAESVASTDVSLRISMANDIDSLNVAAATAVACFALRQHDQDGANAHLPP